VGLLHEALPASTLVIAIDPGKVSNQVWLSSSAAGMLMEPLSLPGRHDRVHRRTSASSTRH